MEVWIAFWALAHIVQALLGCLAWQKECSDRDLMRAHLILSGLASTPPVLSLLALLACARYEALTPILAAAPLAALANVIAFFFALIMLLPHPYRPVASILSRLAGVIAAACAVLVSLVCAYWLTLFFFFV